MYVYIGICGTSKMESGGSGRYERGSAIAANRPLFLSFRLPLSSRPSTSTNPLITSPLRLSLNCYRHRCLINISVCREGDRELKYADHPCSGNNEGIRARIESVTCPISEFFFAYWHNFSSVASVSLWRVRLRLFSTTNYWIRIRLILIFELSIELFYKILRRIKIE